jgi:hypothetical protein
MIDQSAAREAGRGMKATEEHQRGSRKFKILGFLFLLSIPLLIGDAIPPENNLSYAVDPYVHPYRFDLIAWETDALWQMFLGSVRARDGSVADSSSKVVGEYLGLSSEIIALEDEINRAIIREDEESPDKYRQELLAIRSQRAGMEDRAEAALLEQASTVLAEQGFGWDLLGSTRVIPPVSIEMESLPTALVISPRDRIELTYQRYLQPGLPLERREEIEARVDGLGKSSLVTDIGGLSTYPTMIVESPSLEFTLEVIAHEWIHHYLALRPLGWSYFDSPFMRKTNETVADIAGKEIGRLIRRRFYLLAEEAHRPEVPQAEASDEDSPAAFDFKATMRETRRTVDALLADGQVEAAEAYMEERRQEVVRQGYFIRKLNQAYFAFHGSYTDSPTSVDPLGAQLNELRIRSGTLKEFVDLVGQTSTQEEVEAIFDVYGIPR